jgi:hypothetical protein
MSRYFGPNPTQFTWALGTTIEETFQIPEDYGDITGAVPRCHIRGTAATSPLLIALGPAEPPESGFVLDEGARTLKLTISAKDSYDLTGGMNIPIQIAGDIEFRFGDGDTAIVWPFGEFKATLQDRWTYFFDTDAPGGG